MKKLSAYLFLLFISSALQSTPVLPDRCKHYSYGAVINAAISSSDFIRESPLAMTKGEFSECSETMAIHMVAMINEVVPGPTESWSSKMKISVNGILPRPNGNARYEIPVADVLAVRQSQDGSLHAVKFSGPVVMVFADGNANLSFFNWYDNPYFPEQTTLVRHSVVSAVRLHDNN